MPMAEKIRIALIKRNMNLKELSSRLGCTSQNLIWIVILKAGSLVMITVKKSKAIRA